MLLAEIARAFSEFSIDSMLYHIPEMDIRPCCGRRVCHKGGHCVHDDDIHTLMEAIAASELVVLASPSYWGDVTGQMKIMIDRFTPYSNTCPAHASATGGALGAAIAVRAGSNVAENLRLIHTMEHFLNHLDIPLAGQLTAEGIDEPQDLKRRPELLDAAYALGQALAREAMKKTCRRDYD